MVAGVLVVFPHLALVLVPIGLGLALPFVLLAWPLVVVAMAPFLLVAGAVSDLRARRRPPPPPTAREYPPAPWWAGGDA